MSRTIKVGQQESGSTVAVAQGDQVRLELPETRTAGFRWQMVSPESPVFTVHDEGFAAAPGIGGTGLHRWTITALGQGSAVLAMRYGRPWESAATQEFMLTIEVRE